MKIKDKKAELPRNLYDFIIKYSLKQQLILLAITLISFPILYYSLVLPKIIVNQAISGTDFPKIIFGFSFTQYEYLLFLSIGFLLLVITSGGFKYVINVYQGQIGERMLRRLRYKLYSHVLRFPTTYFKKVSQSEIVTIIASEVEPLGGFIGESFSLPIFQGGTLLVYIGFIFMQDPYLGLAAISFYPLQFYVIPKLQRHVNQLSKKRVKKIRQLSYQINETVNGIAQIHSNDTSQYHLAGLSDQLGEIYNIRYEIFDRKFFIKFLNGFFNQITPFFFYAIGGYFVIQGKVSFGALVAVLAAYKDIGPPWKELLKYYETKEDIRVKYKQIIKNFMPDDLNPSSWLKEDREGTQKLEGPLLLKNIGLLDENDQLVLKSLNLKFNLKKHTAIIGNNESGKGFIPELLIRLNPSYRGAITYGAKELRTIPESTLGRHISYVQTEPALYTGTVLENVTYSLKHRQNLAFEGENTGVNSKKLQESILSGNSIEDSHGEWIDYNTSDFRNPSELKLKVLALLDDLNFGDDLYHFGLLGTFPNTENIALQKRLLKARKSVEDLLNKEEFKGLVVRFDINQYNKSASVVENLIFGTPIGVEFSEDKIHKHPFIFKILKDSNLYTLFLEKGYSIAKAIVEHYHDPNPPINFTDKYGFIDPETIPNYEQILEESSPETLSQLSKDQQQTLLSLPFRLIPEKHGLHYIDETFEKKILNARNLFIKDIPKHSKHSIEFYEADKYNTAASVQDNILFGKLSYTVPQMRIKLSALLLTIAKNHNLYTDIQEVGLNSWIGISGSNLTLPQKQKLAFARALIKHPDLLIVDQATALFDSPTQHKVITTVLNRMKGKGIIWVLHKTSLAKHFDHVMVMVKGQLAEEGTYSKLTKNKAHLTKLSAEEK